MDCVETDCQSVTDTFFYSYRELDLFYSRFWLGITLGCLLCLCIIHFGHRTFSYCTFHSVLPAESVETTQDSPFLLFQGGIRESLELDSKDLLYVESNGNYIRVNYQKAGKNVQCLLRATMKQAEEVTAVCPLVLKCHRAFLVNIRKVVKVNGNSQGYRLLLEGCPEEIPVSRGYSKQVKELIEGISGD